MLNFYFQIFYTLYNRKNRKVFFYFLFWSYIGIQLSFFPCKYQITILVILHLMYGVQNCSKKIISDPNYNEKRDVYICVTTRSPRSLKITFCCCAQKCSGHSYKTRSHFNDYERITLLDPTGTLLNFIWNIWLKISFNLFKKIGIGITFFITAFLLLQLELSCFLCTF